MQRAPIVGELLELADLTDPNSWIYVVDGELCDLLTISFFQDEMFRQRAGFQQGVLSHNEA